MMYKCFKHQKTSISTYTLQLKNMDRSGFTLISKHFKMPASLLSLSLSLSGDPDLDLGIFSITFLLLHFFMEIIGIKLKSRFEYTNMEKPHSCHLFCY
ncbi:hypothetical protein HanIR_Chr07g0308251 [Helianthus annuus]|nr:hypothetical protein HanIR_Chr07g0308251 [Helianthus annuus]